ncbi:MAG: hypothetical protein M3Y08_05390 [Fibrobacterota bacterium]|nr:hypothetical protein [Fibrobacterota bacterium]
MTTEPAAPTTDASLSLRILGALLCLAAYAVLKFAFGILICDDAYITLAHARSWNAGLGPIMSAQNPVCATSTPLHTLILALEGVILRVPDYLSMAYFTNLAWDLAGYFFLYRIARRGLCLPEPYALTAVAACALSVNALAVSAYGMETPMYTALALAGTWYAFYAPKSLPGLAVISFLAPLARPEGALLPAVLILLRWRRRKAVAWHRGLLAPPALIPAIATLMGFACFFAFNLYAYGRMLPHSILAKRLEINVGFLDGLQSWVLNVFYKGPCLGGTTLTTLANLSAIAIAAVGFWHARERGSTNGKDARWTLAAGSPVPWELLVWPFLYFLFFTVTRSSYILFTWYYLPVLPFLILFIVSGIERAMRGRLPAGVAWAGLFAFLAYVSFQTFRQQLPQKHVFAEAAREGRYKEAARIVDSLAVPGKIPMVMIDEVGAIGYWSRARILDSHGLLSPEALSYLGPAEGYFQRMAAMQDRFDPDWIMGMRLTRDEGQLHPGEDGLFSGYEAALILRLPPHGYNMELWRRQQPD